MKLSKIKLNPNNPRIIKDDKFKKLVKSIQEFPEMMAKRPMVCVTDADGLLYPLGGNMRLKALNELKYKEIPDSWVVLADEWTEEQRKEFIIKDNVSFGEFDWDTLANKWNAEKLVEWGVNLHMWDEINIATDDNLLTKSDQRGGFDSNGIKFVLGNVTRFIKEEDSMYTKAKELESILLKKDTTEELTEIIWKILNISIL